MSQIFGAELFPRKRLIFLIGCGWACATTPHLDKTFHSCFWLCDEWSEIYNSSKWKIWVFFSIEHTCCLFQLVWNVILLNLIKFNQSEPWSWTNHLYGLPPIFTRKSWSPPSMIFQKSKPPINKDGNLHYVWGHVQNSLKYLMKHFKLRKMFWWTDHFSRQKL